MRSKKGRFVKGHSPSQETRDKMAKTRRDKARPYFPKGVKTTQGYIQLYIPEHPMASRSGYILEHRFVISQKIARILKSNEIVHHINGVKDDNRVENLTLTAKVSHNNFHTGKMTCPYCQETYLVKSMGK